MGRGVKCLESSYTEKDSRVLVYGKSNMSQHVAAKVNHILSCISRSVANRLRKAVIHLR